MDRRTNNYTLLNQTEPQFGSMSGGSSFAGSSISDHCPPSDPDVRYRFSASKGPWGSKSWAQQTQESYQLQLALALRLVRDASSAEDPNFLEEDGNGSVSVQSLVLRFWVKYRDTIELPKLDHFDCNLIAEVNGIRDRQWKCKFNGLIEKVNGCLSYFDKVPDGFYTIHGMNPYVWSVCTDLPKDGRMPSIKLLRGTSPGKDSFIETTFIDMRNDLNLKELQRTILSVSHSCNTKEEVVDQLAKIVSNQMGGAFPSGEDQLVSIWKNCSDNLQQCLGSVVLPIGSLSAGLCRHRALLFKVLAHSINLPCRIAKGCKYCSKEDAASCLVRFDLEKEYLVDLIGHPGCLSESDSLWNGLSSVMISSPLCFPRSQQVKPVNNSKALAKKFFEDFELLDIVFDDPSADTKDSIHPKQHERPHVDRLVHPPRSADSNEFYDTLENASDIVKVSPSANYYNPAGHREVQPRVSMFGSGEDTSGGSSFVRIGKPINELSLDVEDLDISWTDLVLKETIGEGSFGIVHRGDWQGSDVAVKKLVDQEFHPQRLMEFYKEVAIMKRLRHPNIVLFMGAVTKPPNLSIVTEFLSRGSLYRLLHKSGERRVLDDKRKLNMAYDVASGMNYLHNRNPPIVHRDLKSPNLLVDKKYTVKVCDFGLSRLKANTYLSSKSAAGTPEWMAPEVLRSEPSNEKSDVYSFGVVLWELFTLQKPWSNLKAPQVVEAVGFQSKRLEIPRNINPQVASMIEACWASEPYNRPSFSSIMESLKNLIKSLTSQPVPADMNYLHEKPAVQ